MYWGEGLTQHAVSTSLECTQRLQDGSFRPGQTQWYSLSGDMLPSALGKQRQVPTTALSFMTPEDSVDTGKTRLD